MVFTSRRAFPLSPIGVGELASRTHGLPIRLNCRTAISASVTGDPPVNAKKGRHEELVSEFRPGISYSGQTLNVGSV